MSVILLLALLHVIDLVYIGIVLKISKMKHASYKK